MGVSDPLDRLEAAGLDTSAAAAIAGNNASRLLRRADTEPATA